MLDFVHYKPIQCFSLIHLGVSEMPYMYLNLLKNVFNSPLVEIGMDFRKNTIWRWKLKKNEVGFCEKKTTCKMRTYQDRIIWVKNRLNTLVSCINDKIQDWQQKNHISANSVFSAKTLFFLFNLICILNIHFDASCIDIEDFWLLTQW